MEDAESQPGPDDRPGQLVWQLAKIQRRLLAYVSTLVGNRHDAEDVMQRASIIMWKQFDRFELGTDFLAWSSTIAYYEAKNFLRVSGRAKVKFDDALLALLSDEKNRAPERGDRRLDALQDCVQKVDEAGRSLLLGVYAEGGSVVSLAEALGKAPKTLYNRLSMLRQALAECIERQLQGEPT